MHAHVFLCDVLWCGVYVCVRERGEREREREVGSERGGGEKER